MKVSASLDDTRNGAWKQAWAASGYRDVLTVYDKERIPQDFPMDSPVVTIGRATGNDIVLDDYAVSRFHIRVERRAEKWIVVDLNSTNGALVGRERLTADAPLEWEVGSPMLVGPYQMRWVRHFDGVEEAPDRTLVLHAPTEAPDVEVATRFRETVEVGIQADRRSVQSGDQIRIEMTMLNLGMHADDFRIDVQGIPAAWVQLPVRRVRLEPTEIQRTTFAIIVPDSSLAVRGGYEYKVVLQSLSDKETLGSDTGQFTIEEQHDFALNVRQIEKGFGAVCDVQIDNRGNSADFYNVSAISADPAVKFNARQWQIALTPATSDNLRILIQPEDRPLLGRTVESPFHITVASNSGLEQSYHGAVSIQPRITWRMFAIVCVLMVLLTAAVLVGMTVFRNADQAAALVEPITQTVALLNVDLAIAFGLL